jgi:hypothetical protein
VHIHIIPSKQPNITPLSFTAKALNIVNTRNAEPEKANFLSVFHNTMVSGDNERHMKHSNN